MERYWSLFSLIFILAACITNNISTNEPEKKAETPTIDTELSDLPDLGEAPELMNEVWLNTPEPLQLASLRGQVILLDMWTFG